MGECQYFTLSLKPITGISSIGKTINLFEISHFFSNGCRKSLKRSFIWKNAILLLYTLYSSQVSKVLSRALMSFSFLLSYFWGEVGNSSTFVGTKLFEKWDINIFRIRILPNTKLIEKSWTMNVETFSPPVFNRLVFLFLCCKMCLLHF